MHANKFVLILDRGWQVSFRLKRAGFGVFAPLRCVYYFCCTELAPNHSPSATHGLPKPICIYKYLRQTPRPYRAQIDQIRLDPRSEAAAMRVMAPACRE
jgi:hypothetical protein